MSIEIKELVIRAVVDPRAREPERAAAPAPVETPDAIVAAAVKEVLRLLRAAKER